MRKKDIIREDPLGYDDHQHILDEEPLKYLGIICVAFIAVVFAAAIIYSIFKNHHA